MKLEKIVKMKDNKYKIYIDGEAILTFDNVLLENDLLYKKDIDFSLYNKIIKDTLYYDVYNKTVKYILKKRRSEKEIIDYLEKFDLTENDKNKLIAKLKAMNFINDKEFCRAFVNDKIYLSKNGINKIRIELLEHNIPITMIDEELNKIDNEVINDRLEKLILKKINSNNKFSNYHLKQKILNDMIMLGYSKNSVIEIIDKNLKDDREIALKEFDKMYNKLSKKYSGSELIAKFKQKLLAKGFLNEDINLYIKKKEDC